MMRHLRGLGNRLTIHVPTDEGGYLGRECPNGACKGYFKIVPGTGLKGVTACHCPYCGHTASQSGFATRDQIQYARSVTLRTVHQAVQKDLKELEFEVKPKGPLGLGISMKLRPGPLHPLHSYREKALETYVECANCALKYAVYGVFAFCPDCGEHNSLQILRKNLEVVGAVLDIAAAADGELATRLMENALENCVSAFDGFGREVCRIHARISADPPKAEKVSFQSLERANKELSVLFKIDLAAGLTNGELRAAVQAFQKRHLLSHKMGVVDSDYVRKSGDVNAVVGRKVNIRAEEIRELASIVGKLGAYLSSSLLKPHECCEAQP